MRCSPLNTELSITGGLVKDIIDYLQLGANGIVLTILGWLYFAYIRNLKSEAKLKDEQVKASEKNMAFWKDKASNWRKNLQSLLKIFCPTVLKFAKRS